MVEAKVELLHEPCQRRVGYALFRSGLDEGRAVRVGMKAFCDCWRAGLHLRVDSVYIMPSTLVFSALHPFWEPSPDCLIARNEVEGECDILVVQQA